MNKKNDSENLNFFSNSSFWSCFGYCLFSRTLQTLVNISICTIRDIPILFFELGRPWPVFLGTGIGLGMGYGNCQSDFRTPYVPPASLLVNRTNTSSQTVRYLQYEKNKEF